MPGPGRPKKNPFDALPEGFADKVNASSRDELNNIFADVAKSQAENDKAQAEDMDLKEKKAIAADAGAVYRETRKMNKLKLSFLRQALEDKGG